MERRRFDLDRVTVNIVTTDRSDGSFALDVEPAVLSERRAAVCDRNWFAVRQIHGSTIVDAGGVGGSVPGSAATGEPVADGAVTFTNSHAVSVLTADCAPVVLVGSTGIAVIHAGWRGAVAGVIGAAARQLAAGGAQPIASVLGPCIQPEAYEFGANDLLQIVTAFGGEVATRRSDGSAALDLTRVIQISCERAGWPAPERPSCTSSTRFFSHRTRRDVGRQATVAWLDHR